MQTLAGVRDAHSRSLKFVRASVAIALWAFSLVKLADLTTQSSRFLDLIDPVLGVKYAYLLPMVSLIEFVVAVIVYFSRSAATASRVLIALGACFVNYHVFRIVLGGQEACPCFGGIGRYFEISPDLLTSASQVMAVALVIAGTYIFRIAIPMAAQQRPSNRTLRSASCS